MSTMNLNRYFRGFIFVLFIFVSLYLCICALRIHKKFLMKLFSLRPHGNIHIQRKLRQYNGRIIALHIFSHTRTHSNALYSTHTIYAKTLAAEPTLAHVRRSHTRRLNAQKFHFSMDGYNHIPFLPISYSLSPCACVCVLHSTSNK